MPGKLPTYTIHPNGFAMPKGFPIDGFNSGLQYCPEDEDIFLSTYPKCGTTWCQYLIYLLLNKGNPIPKDQKLDKISPHLEEVGNEVVERLPKPRIIKTHLPFNLTPYSSKAKYIYVARNPKDCCVSFFHHTRGFPKHYDFADGKFADYFELFVEGKVDFGDYFDNFISWFEHRDDDNVLFLLYEDMKCDIVASILKLGEFLGGVFMESVRDDSTLRKVLENSTIESMKQKPLSWASERPSDMPAFIRKGEIGDWKNYFSEEQNRRMNEKIEKKLNGTDAAELWKKYDCV